MMYGTTINMKVVDRLVQQTISANIKVRNIYLKEKCVILVTSLYATNEKEV